MGAQKKNTIIILIVFLLLLSLSCSISFTPKEEHEKDGIEAILEDIPQQPEMDEPITAEQDFTAPVSLNRGLSSLNSYTFTLRILNSGPSAQDRSDMTITTSFTADNDNTFTRMDSISASADDPEESRSSSANYRVGSTSCSIDYGEETEAEVEEFTPAQKEIMDIFYNLWDTVINVDNQVWVGTEMINGVNCNHFTFDVVGLGKTSGANVSQSSGEYWSAVDGNYLVKYDVVLETRDAPASDGSAKVMRSEVHYSLTDINAPITISLPPECSAP